ncbi:Ribosome biogenesis protein BOP1 [Trichuris trichiura]|uniref:Ribosome biogenesis protein BOP1 n=1 Tax=Trichuris trichiura TaxID=36087 RepID=A0A077ZJT3_TRITR|nr:Ribosome biogenesis protein BOP1 [Trichuris trichiura]
MKLSETSRAKVADDKLHDRVKVFKRLKTALDHVNVFARRNGFACLYDVTFDQPRLRFSASLKVGDRDFSGIGKSKRTAKQQAALSFLRFLCSGGVQANWGLPKDAAECEAYL